MLRIGLILLGLGILSSCYKIRADEDELIEVPITNNTNIIQDSGRNPLAGF